MSDEIKPVPPTRGIPPKLPPRTPEHPESKGGKSPEPKHVQQESDGYDLSGITSEQAQQLLAMPLMDDAGALANTDFVPLKEALARRAAGDATEQGDAATLTMASQRVASL